ncbi:response regulator [Candidatus Kaiserbacteria bacterium]|nr:response regulator [Candidatus Kaiserbacteria bacterium]
MEQRQVVIIEDDEVLRELYTKIISDAGVTVHAAATGGEGVTLTLKHHPDVVLVDVMLPDISGHDAVKQIRLDTWGRDATIIYLTNRTDAASVFTAVEQGSDEYIIKAHTTPKELLNKVRSAMLA